LDFAILDMEDHFECKLNVICEVEANLMTSTVEIADRLGLALSSLSKIMLNKNKIIEGEVKCGMHSKNRINIKLGANEGLEKILLEWFQQMCSINVSTGGPILCQKVTDVALRQKMDSFKASDGWLHRHLK
jgi:hypothetical protein